MWTASSIPHGSGIRSILILPFVFTIWAVTIITEKILVWFVFIHEPCRTIIVLSLSLPVSGLHLNSTFGLGAGFQNFQIARFEWANLGVTSCCCRDLETPP